MSNNNPFADAFKAFGADKYSEAFNWDKAIASGQANAKAFANAAKAAADGFQMIANRQATLSQKQAEEVSKFFSSFASSKSPEGALEQITKAAKANAESALANSKELFEVASKSASEAAEILNKRLSAAISEYSETATASNSDTKKKNAA